MALEHLQKHPLIALIATVYSTTISLIKPDDVLLNISAWGGAAVIILTIIAKIIEISNKWKERKKLM